MRWYVYCSAIIVVLRLGPETAVAADLTVEAGSTLRRAAGFFSSIATHGGYAGIYSTDLRDRYGESEYQVAAADEIWVQPPGTPSVGACFLRAYRVTGDIFYRDGAANAANALAWGQDANGGWPYLASVGGMALGAPGERPVRGNSAETTLDDSTTQAALTFLIDANAVFNQPWLSEAITLGMNFMLASQGPAGGWPQVYPPRGDYANDYTFNDGVTNAAIALMLKAYRAYGDKRFQRSALRGADFILKSQLPEPQPGWTQQYDRELHPSPARAFEPVAVDSSATANNIETLIEIHAETDDDRYLEPVPAAVAWLERSAIEPTTWSRFYEIGSNHPIYPDRDGRIHYSFDALPEADRQRYSYRGSFGIPRTIKVYHGLVGDEESQSGDRVEREQQRLAAANLAERRLSQLIASLDPQGRWIQNDRIRTRTFVNNCKTILDYVERARRHRERQWPAASSD